MKVSGTAIASIVLVLSLGGAAAPAFADDACDGFKWDVGKERALFAGSAVSEKAGTDGKSAPVVRPNRFYELKLTLQDEVVLSASASRRAPSGPAFAGIAMLKVSKAGSYRVSIDGPYWIDVLSNGTLTPAKDFAALHGCNAPRKIVVFDLAAAGSYVLQVSSADQSSVRLTVTAAPLRKL